MKKAGTILLISAFLLTFMITKSINVMQDTKEVWIDIQNYVGVYQVSNYGRVKRLKKLGVGSRNRPFTRPEKILKPYLCNGYPTVDFGGVGTSVHRLVAMCFIPNPENKPQVNHIDSNRANNFVSNLEWVTPSENSKHAVVYGNMFPLGKGENHHSAKLTEDQVREIRKIRENTGMSTNKLAVIYGVHRSSIKSIVRKLTWQHI